MILSAMQTERGKGLLRIDGDVVAEHETIEAARVDLIQRERELLRLYPHAKHCSQMLGEDLTVTIEIPEPEVEPAEKAPATCNQPLQAAEAPAVAKPARVPPTYDDNPRAFMRWRLGVIQRCAERLREEQQAEAEDVLDLAM